MTRRTWALAAILGVILAALVITVPTRRSEAFAGATLVAFVGAFIVLSDAVGRGSLRASVVDAVVRRPPPRTGRPSDLEKLERSLGWKVYEGAEFDVRVRPLLADLARYRGATDEETHALLRHGERVTTTDLDRMVAAIEGVGRERVR